MTSLMTLGSLMVRNNFTLNHLAERIKYYVDESFEYRMIEVPLSTSEGVLVL